MNGLSANIISTLKKEVIKNVIMIDFTSEVAEA